MKHILIIAVAAMALGACSKKDNDVLPVVKIKTPTANGTLRNNQSTQITVETSMVFSYVSYYFNGKLIAQSNTPPYSAIWTPTDVVGGTHTLQAIASYGGQKAEAIQNVKFTVVLGEKFRGGTVFYTDGDGSQGLIAADEDIFTGSGHIFKWGVGGYIGAGSTTDGRANTNAMKTSVTGISYAGYPFANGYYRDGYDDWYIPSMTELIKLYQGRHYISGIPATANDAWYWSSTEVTDGTSYALNMGNGMSDSSSKNTAYRVRPIRRY